MKNVSCGAEISARWGPPNSSRQQSYLLSLSESLSAPPGPLPSDELMVLLAHGQHGTGRMADDPLGGAAQEYMSQARIAVRRDNDQIRFQSPRCVRDFAVGSAGSHKLLLNDTLVQRVLFAQLFQLAFRARCDSVVVHRQRHVSKV